MAEVATATELRSVSTLLDANDDATNKLIAVTLTAAAFAMLT